ncbi:hypothetical protein [Corallococcus sp. AB030]|uniref:hypothetical protein n=1 Tax=Corallococcus sp. AB030 TaxID=2316716 RepID=UPI0011E5A8DB|nr:hypothetical protein [Corallococcus sp. AB030]
MAARVVEVELVGPRAGTSCVLAGFEFVGGVARVPADAQSALDILATYHSAYPRESRDFEAAQAKWEERQWKGDSAGEASSTKEVARAREAVEDLKAELEASRREREELAARLARAEGAKSGSTPAPEASAAPATESQEKPPKPGKAAK